MSRVLMIGAGGVATVAAFKIAQNADVFTEFMIASRRKAKCDKIVEDIHKAGYQLDIKTRYSRGCLAGIDYCIINPIGKVRPCAYMMEEAGDVHDTPFDEIWANADVFKKLRTKAYSGACGKCKFNDRCGGCRARAAYYHDGDYMQEDSYCAYGRGL